MSINKLRLLGSSLESDVFLLLFLRFILPVPGHRAISRTIDRRLKGKAGRALINSTGSYLGWPKFRFFPDVTFHSPSESFRCAVNHFGLYLGYTDTVLYYP